MALAVAGPVRMGFRIRECGRNNWGFGLRNGRVVPLVLDRNSWVQLDSTDEAYGRWPSKKLLELFGLSWPKSMLMPRPTLRPMCIILRSGDNWMPELFLLICSGASRVSMPPRLGTHFVDLLFIYLFISVPLVGL